MWYMINKRWLCFTYAYMRCEYTRIHVYIRAIGRPSGHRMMRMMNDRKADDWQHNGRSEFNHKSRMYETDKSIFDGKFQCWSISCSFFVPVLRHAFEWKLLLFFFMYFVCEGTTWMRNYSEGQCCCCCCEWAIIIIIIIHLYKRSIYSCSNAACKFH